MPNQDLSRAEVTGISTEERLRRVAYSALIFIGFVTLVVALDLAQSILAPLVLAVIIGLVFGPLVDGIEAYGVPAWFSAMTAVFTVAYPHRSGDNRICRAAG